MLPGYVYHLTQRCHDRKTLLKRVRARDEYRKRLRNILKGSGVSLVSYCLTSNHVHLAASAEEPDRISRFMQRQQGEFAKWYNRSGGRSGAFWNERYHCTMVETGDYLWNCMRYIDLNMVRAGVVPHPLAWRWCGYDELVGRRKRYRVLDVAKVLEVTECASITELAGVYEAFVNEALSANDLKRQARWTESIAVGSKPFVSEIAGRTRNRTCLDFSQTSDGTWAVRETRARYGLASSDCLGSISPGEKSF
jgi:putative transposase